MSQSRNAKSSVTDPIAIAEVTHPSYPGKIGITICPGKKGPSSFGGVWDRDLDTDLSAIVRDFNPALVLTLMTDAELSASGVPELGEGFRSQGIRWIHFPITEITSLEVSLDEAWFEMLAQILAVLRKGIVDSESFQQRNDVKITMGSEVTGSNVLVHDRGGLGRSGTLAAVLLIELGMSSKEAAAEVRTVRPGAIETNRQETFVHQYIASDLPEHIFCWGCVGYITRVWGHTIGPMFERLRDPSDKATPAMRKLCQIYVEDFEHYIGGIGDQVDTVAKILGLRSKRFPRDLTEWGDTYEAGYSMTLYQRPDEPKRLVDWWRYVSKNDPELTGSHGGYDRDDGRGAITGPRMLRIKWHTLNQDERTRIRKAMDSSSRYFDDYNHRFQELYARYHRQADYNDGMGYVITGSEFRDTNDEPLLKNELQVYTYWSRLNEYHLSMGVEFPRGQFWDNPGSERR